MNTRFTLKDVLEFCWTNKGKHGFHRFTYEQAAATIVNAADHEELLIISDNGGICGVALFFVLPEYVYVRHIFARGPGFAALIKESQKRFPGYVIRGQRGTKVVTYNFNKKSYGRLH